MNAQQRHVVESVLSGYSTFFTGPAGSGKSHILSYICRCLNEEEVWNCIAQYSASTNKATKASKATKTCTPKPQPYKKKKIIITGTTGLSSCIAGGTTIHSFAGCAIENELSSMLNKVLGNKYALQRWREVDVLIIDEVSMMPALFLDNLSAIASRARNDRRVFGGIQLVLCGDFFQLPPVNLDKNQFAFEAKVWPQIIQTSICLEQIYRQEGDNVFMELLNEARIGELSPKSLHLLREHAHKCAVGIPLSSKPLVEIKQEDTEEMDKDGQKRKKKGDEKDCQVEVIDVDSSPTTKSSSNKSKATKKKATKGKKKKVPKKKRKSIKHHIRPTLLECKNAVVDRLNQTELTKLEGKNCRYQARDKSLNKVYQSQLKHCQAPEVLNLKVGAHVILLKNIDSEKGLVNGVRGIVEDFALAKRPSDLPREYRKMEFPVVVFDSIPKSKISADGTSKTTSGKVEDDSDGEDEAITKTIEPTEWTNKVGDMVVSSRWQIPLRLGYALTVHKSQGMTIDHLAVNLSDTFEYGQAYVALSRAKSLDKLILKGFREDCFKAHPTVKQFYAMLQGKLPQSTSTSTSSSVSSFCGAKNDTKQGASIIPAPNRYLQQSGPLVSTSSSSSSQMRQHGRDSSDHSLASQNINLTPEQLERIEANRLRALAIRQKRMQSKP